MSNDQSLREHLVYVLKGEGAHVAFADAVDGLAPELRARRAAGFAHSAWELLEHMRIAQRDILEFTRNDPGYAEREFPAGYWPSAQTPPDEAAWDRSIAQFRADLQQFIDLVSDRSNDVLAPLPQSRSGATIMAQAFLTSDHNAYHLGQLVAVRQLLGAWG